MTRHPEGNISLKIHSISHRDIETTIHSISHPETMLAGSKGLQQTCRGLLITTVGKQAIHLRHLDHPRSILMVLGLAPLWAHPLAKQITIIDNLKVQVIGSNQLINRLHPRVIIKVLHLQLIHKGPYGQPNQGSLSSTQSYGPNAPAQQPYPYASSEPMQQSYPQYPAAPSQGGQSGAPQHAPTANAGYGYTQSGPAASYGQYLATQPGFTEQPPTANAGYGYQGC